MKRGIGYFLLLLVAVSFVSCSTVTIRPQGTAKLTSDPTWESSKAFFLWGLIGQANVNVDQICHGRGVKQMQAQDTFVDGLLGTITFGIYMPRTAKVWCN